MKKYLKGVLVMLLTVVMMSAMVTMNVKAEGGVQIATYTVTFDTNGQGTAPDQQTVYEGGVVSPVDDLTADGYTFGGWYKEPDCINAWDFELYTVSENTILYAKWTAVPEQNVNNNIPVSPVNEDSTSNETVNPTNAGSSEDNSSATNEIKIPTITSPNSNTQITSWADVNSILKNSDGTDLAAVSGTTDPMLQIDISGTGLQIIPAATVNLLNNSKVTSLHAFLGDGDAVTFMTNDLKSVKEGYITTSFKRTDTVVGNRKTIAFKSNQDLGTNILLHTKVPLANTSYLVYMVDSTGKRMDDYFICKSLAQGVICFPISKLGTYVFEPVE